MNVLITGTAGFIGFHVVKRFIEAGHQVLGLDNINDYYSVSLKYDRLATCGIGAQHLEYNQISKSTIWPSYSFLRLNIEDTNGMANLFDSHKFDLVIHLAAQAGVRYSLENPIAYIKSNIMGFFNIMEGCRIHHVPKLVYASSSSVYGISGKALLSVTDRTDEPVSLYAATKKSNEVLAYSYSHLYNIQMVGLRFFTVYGPWGRPDMAPFLFTDAIVNDRPIKVFNHGNMQRDFTYIDDIVDGVFHISIQKQVQKYLILNIGNSAPIKIMYFIECLEKELNRRSTKEMHDMQPGDVMATWADTSQLLDLIGYEPKTTINDGVNKFVTWFKEYYAS